MTRGRPRITEERFCTLEWCEGKLYAKDLCRTHYNGNRLGHKPRDPRAEKPKCAFGPCDRDARASQWCGTHYMQHYKGQELRPIAPRRTDATRPGERNCKECGEWKSQDNFHKGSTPGQWQSRCKPCYNKHQRRNTLIRRGREIKIVLP